MGGGRAVWPGDRTASRQQNKTAPLLATFEELNAGLIGKTTAYPVYRSRDSGRTWSRIAEIRDTETRIQAEWNPFLLNCRKLWADSQGTPAVPASPSTEGTA